MKVDIETIKRIVESIKHDGYDLSVASLIEDHIPHLIEAIESSSSASWNAIEKFFKENEEVQPYAEEVSRKLFDDQCYSTPTHYIFLVQKLLEVISDLKSEIEDFEQTHLDELNRQIAIRVMDWEVWNCQWSHKETKLMMRIDVKHWNPIEDRNDLAEMEALILETNKAHAYISALIKPTDETGVITYLDIVHLLGLSPMQRCQAALSVF